MVSLIISCWCYVWWIKSCDSTPPKEQEHWEPLIQYTKSDGAKRLLVYYCNSILSWNMEMGKLCWKTLYVRLRCFLRGKENKTFI